MRKTIQLIKDFKKISFWGHSNWKSYLKVLTLLPCISFNWDTQCKPEIDFSNGSPKVFIEGYREFYIVFEWLWFCSGMTFEFKWTVLNPEEFRRKPPTEEEIKKMQEMFTDMENKLTSF
jgi:hypothetical protein